MTNSAIKITVNKNEPCICGSGKEFSDCCMKKNHSYEGLLKDDGTYGIYDLTEFMAAAKGLLIFIDTRVNSETFQLPFSSSSKKLNKLYEKLATTLNPIEKVASCKVGCNHCCHLPVLTSKLEYEVIKDFINHKFSGGEKENLKNKINLNKQIFENMQHKEEKFSKVSYDNYIKMTVPCAFLDETNRCSIYNVRPFVCRKYLVFNNSSVCKDPSLNTTQYYAKYLTTVKDAIGKLNKLTYNKLDYNHLLTWFLES